MSVKIFYNGVDVFSGLATPIIARSENPVIATEKYGTTESFTLNGQINACSFEDFVTKQNQIISGFNSDFKTLEIIQDNVTILEKPLVKLENISFDDSLYVGIVPYSISISCYTQDSFKQYFGVLDPSDSVSFEERDDQVHVIRHEISARGFNTSALFNNSLENAKNFVLGRTGVNGVRPHFTCSNNFQPCLKSFSETIDRVRGSYSVTEEYLNDLFYSNRGVLRFESNFNSGINDFATVSIQGSFQGCRSQTIEEARASFSGISIDSEAYKAYTGFVGQTGGFNPNPIVREISEDTINRIINFNFVFNNDPSPDIVIDSNAQVTSGEFLTEVSVDGRIFSQRGTLKDRWNKVQAEFSGLNIFNIANKAYVEAGYSNIALNPVANSSGVTRNSFAAEISFRANFDNRDAVDPLFERLDYETSVEPAFFKFSSIPLAKNESFNFNGGYDVLDLGYFNRGAITLNGQAIKKQNSSFEACINVIKNIANNEFIGFVGSKPKTFVTQNSITTGTPNSISFSFSWSFDGSPINSQGSPETIVSLMP